MAELPPLPDAEMEKQSIEAVAHYAGGVLEKYGKDIAVIILRENLRGLALAYGEIAGHDNAGDFMELMAGKQHTFAGYERGYQPFKDGKPIVARIARADNVVQFSKRYRKTGKATP